MFRKKFDRCAFEYNQELMGSQKRLLHNPSPFSTFVGRGVMKQIKSEDVGGIRKVVKKMDASKTRSFYQPAQTYTDWRLIPDIRKKSKKRRILELPFSPEILGLQKFPNFELTTPR